MANIMEMLVSFEALVANLDEGEKIPRFLSLIEEFNERMPIETEFKERIEKHFDYRWKNDKVQAINDEA